MQWDLLRIPPGVPQKHTLQWKFCHTFNEYRVPHELDLLIWDQGCALCALLFGYVTSCYPPLWPDVAWQQRCLSFPLNPQLSSGLLHRRLSWPSSQTNLQSPAHSGAKESFTKRTTKTYTKPDLQPPQPAATSS